jgi:hypothetical protein
MGRMADELANRLGFARIAFGCKIPRVAVGIPERVNRLKALGNGQVPACAAAAWHLLTEEVQ